MGKKFYNLVGGVANFGTVLYAINSSELLVEVLRRMDVSLYGMHSELVTAKMEIAFSLNKHYLPIWDHVDFSLC